MQIRVDPKCVLEMLYGASGITLFGHCQTKLVMRISKVGVVSNGELVMHPSVRKISEFGEHDSKIVLSECISWLDANSEIEVCLCARQIALFVKDDARVVVNFSVFRIDPQSLFKMVPGSGEIPVSI